MDIKNNFNIKATMVANDFIDNYMIKANGEYVKVYLYLLRHAGDDTDISAIADALEHTEADIKRALTYWEKLGALHMDNSTKAVKDTALEEDKRTQYTADMIDKLASDEEFTQILYIAEQYLNRPIKQRDSEVIAYLYDGLNMSADMIEYVIEYCVQCQSTSMRYIETVALSWHEKGFKSVEEAKAYTSTFSRYSYTVKKAFGITNRNLTPAELNIVDKWFKDYGFTKEVVNEACSRTIESTHGPEFKYADKILTTWKNAGVKHISDIKALDEQHKQVGSRKKSTQIVPANKFHNYNERTDIDYDALLTDIVRQKYEKQEG